MKRLIEELNQVIVEGDSGPSGWQDYKVDAATRFMTKVAESMRDGLEKHGYDVTKVHQNRGSVWVRFKPTRRTAKLDASDSAIPGELVAQVNVEGALICLLNNAGGTKGIPTMNLANETPDAVGDGILIDFADSLGTYF